VFRFRTGESAEVRKAAQARLGLTEAPPERMSEDQLAAIVDAFGGLLGLLRGADQYDRAEIYARIGLQMIYRPGTETVLAGIRSKELDRVPVIFRYDQPRGGSNVVIGDGVVMDV
jgi:site-specific DNA recombinase